MQLVIRRRFLNLSKQKNTNNLLICTNAARPVTGAIPEAFVMLHPPCYNALKSALLRERTGSTMGVNISVGISEFSEIRKNGYYYIDKTGLIEELVKNSGAKVTLITRPRRFGKTLAMNMLAEFFDIRKDSSSLFEGLKVSQDKGICSKWMNKWPVLFISF